MSRKFSPPNPQDVIARYHAGASAKQLGNEFGVQHWTIIQWLRRIGITPRTQSECEYIKWHQMTPEQRAQQVNAAHKANSGCKRSLEDRMKTAQGFYRNQAIRGVGSHREFELMKWLGGNFEWQYPIGPYNVDFAIAELRIAVEVQCGEFGRRDPKRCSSVKDERLEYIFNAGWRILIAAVPHHRVSWPIVAEKCLSFANFIRSNPTVIGQYGMIGGYGEPMSRAAFNHNKWTRIPNF